MPPTATPEPSITLAAVGDLMLARDVTTLMQEHGATYPFDRVRELLAADLLVGNLEGTLTERGTRLSKQYTFRTPPALASGLVEVGFDAVALGNNHGYDFGADGLTDTVEALRAIGLPFTGLGETEAQARVPVILEARGQSIALLSYSAVTDSSFATASRGGVARALQTSIAADVSEARGRSDFVVVMLHDGAEYRQAVTSTQRALSRAAVDAGADLVIGSHAHVLQGWERYADGLIVYGLGNFVFDLDAGDVATYGVGPFETAIAVFTLRADAPPAVEFRPAYIDAIENRPRPATPEEAARVRAALSELR